MLIDPSKLKRNPDNPRLIFRLEDMNELQQSIHDQGILVPLTVFRDGKSFKLLDGERRWRCALKLGLDTVPAVVQPKPERLQNIMMMFAIHHARKDWDPLPTALKLRDLENEFEKQQGRKPTEQELAGLSSQTRGEVRRLKKLLNLPLSYITELLGELEKPKSEQVLTVDHVIETTTAASLLRKRQIVDDRGEDQLRRAIIKKFRKGVINNTVAPRKLARLARGVERREITLKAARNVIERLIDNPAYTIDMAFRDSVEQADFEHGLEQRVDRLIALIDELESRKYRASRGLITKLQLLAKRLQRLK